MKNRWIFSLIILILLSGCARNVKVEKAPANIPAQQLKIEEKIEKPPEHPMPNIDFSNIPLEIKNILPLEGKFYPYNSYSPKISPDENYISFEANQIEYKKIMIYKLEAEKRDNKTVIISKRAKEIDLNQQKANQSIENLIESGNLENYNESFNYEFNWFPNSRNFIFTSNAGLGEYNLFLGSLEINDPLLEKLQKLLSLKKIGEYLMLTEGVKKDGQAKVSPDGSKVVFTSGRTGNGDLYLLNLNNGTLRRLTSTDDTDLYPKWSPDGKNIVFSRGGKYSQDIYIIRDVDGVNEREEPLVTWFFDDVLPNFSPNGKYISFYTTYNLERDPFNTKRWGLMIIPSDGSSPKAGKELTKYFAVPNVIKDNSQGVAWFPDNENIILAKNIDSDYNPIYIYNIKTKKTYFIESGTNINHDFIVSPHGLVCFRAQYFGWDRIFLANTSYFEVYLDEVKKLK
ncbi:MAG: hypothetical protein DRP84_07760 [Spirochaetes bacterium]|nr:MAG: hypothetical protein DRP84_07760 [Spirochaetota bacterium]